MSPNNFVLTISGGMFLQVKRMFATLVIKLTPNNNIGVDLGFAIIAQYANRVAVTVEEYDDCVFKGRSPNKEYLPAEVAEIIEGHYLVFAQVIFQIVRDWDLPFALILSLWFIHAYLRENVAVCSCYKDSTTLFSVLNTLISNVTAARH